MTQVSDVGRGQSCKTSEGCMDQEHCDLRISTFENLEVDKFLEKWNSSTHYPK